MTKVSTRSAGNGSKRPSVLVLAPYLWLTAFFLIPFLIVFKLSLSQTTLAQPPYTPVFELGGGLSGLFQFVSGLSVRNYATLVADALYFTSYLKSLEVAALSTAILLVLGYPLAYAMAQAPRRFRDALVMLVMLPFWTSFLIRVYAWINILQHDGVFNQTLMALHVIDDPISFLSTDFAVFIGLVYSYFPFMVLPLYSTLERMDPTLYESAADLGCPPWRRFWAITLPLSRSGVVAGSLLCFIPIVGEFVIPDLLGGSSTMMIGQTLWTEFFANRDWPVASAVAIVLLALLTAPIAAYQDHQMRYFETGL
jgi:putrescine transport system permease protein